MVRVSSPPKLRPWSDLAAKMVMGVIPGFYPKKTLFVNANQKNFNCKHKCSQSQPPATSKCKQNSCSPPKKYLVPLPKELRCCIRWEEGQSIVHVNITACGFPGRAGKQTTDHLWPQKVYFLCFYFLRYWEEPSMDQSQSRGKLLMNLQGHWSMQIFPENKTPRDESIWISLEFHVRQWPPNLSESSGLNRYRSIECSSLR